MSEVICFGDYVRRLGYVGRMFVRDCDEILVCLSRARDARQGNTALKL